MSILMAKMKSHPNNKNKNFIAGWYIEPSVCDNLIEYFEDEKTEKWEGAFGDNGKPNKWIKDSIDANFWPSTNDSRCQAYFDELQKCVPEYLKLYPEANQTSLWSICRYGVQLQKYKPGGAYFKEHFERAHGAIADRFLVYMTYLNDVTDGGGTYFKYQDLEVKAEKGLTIIWPTDFTHTHKGIVSHTQTKYIATGWYAFNDMGKGFKNYA